MSGSSLEMRSGGGVVEHVVMAVAHPGPGHFSKLLNIYCGPAALVNMTEGQHIHDALDEMGPCIYRPLSNC
jgi:hypothetical protein